MGNYITSSDIERVISKKEVVDLLNDANRNVTITDGIISNLIDEIITEAEDLVNGYLRGRYDTPLSTVPSIIKRITLNVFRYYLYDRRNISIPQNIVDSYDESVSQLENIRKGLLDLGIENTSSTKDGSFFIKINKEKSDVIFGDKNNSDAKYNLDNYL